MLTRIFNFVKMTWMLTWRLAIPSFILFHGPHWNIILPVALVISAGTVFALNKTLVVWPLLKLIQRKPIIEPADTWSGEKAPEKPDTPTPAPHKPTGSGSYNRSTPQPTQRYLPTASQVGRITGYEPDALKARPVPRTMYMTGVPGSGLSDAEEGDYGSMSEAVVALGKEGEENFARALQAAGLLHRFHTTWSLPVPDQERFIPASYNADIDCALGTGRTIFLVDLKNYKSGNVRYYAEGAMLFCEDVPTGALVGETRHMTQNMQNATLALRGHFPDANIVPVVVFMPTNKGEGTIDNVMWPGGIRAMNLTQFLAELAAEPDFSWQAPHGGALARMGNLLRMREQRR